MRGSPLRRQRWNAPRRQSLAVTSRESTELTPSEPLQIEDLFYNTPTRLKSLRSSGDEYSRLLQVVLTYSIHNSGIAFSCKKANTATNSSADISTVVGASVLDNIGVHFGEVVRRELIEVAVDDAGLGVKASGWFSGPNYGAKKSTFMFFINSQSAPAQARQS